MAEATTARPMSAAGFLASDATQTVKHQFGRGAVCPLGQPPGRLAAHAATSGTGKTDVALVLNVAMPAARALNVAPQCYIERPCPQEPKLP